MNAEQSMTEAPEQQTQNAQQSSEDDQHSGGSGGYEVDEDGQRIPHGQGQSKSSRRRRRKRKGKGSEAGPGVAGAEVGGEGPAPTLQADGDAQPAPQGNGGGPSVPAQGSQGAGFRQNSGQGRSFQGSAQAGNGQPGNAQNQGGAQNGNAPGGTKRWKKKFRDRDRPARPADAQGGQQGAAPSGGGGGFRGPDTHQPGNGGGGGFKRKGGFGGGSSGGKQQRGPRSFVGPMDHSYRVVNGNVFDGAASTTDQQHSGGGRGRSYNGDSQPIDYSQGRAIPIAPGTPTKIYFFIEDLFFTAKIQETARKLGVKVAFIKNEKEQIATLVDGADPDRPALIVFDLNNANAKPMTLIPKLKTKLKKTTSIIGFLSHLQGDLKAKAVEAGCDTVMPRAAFSQNLPNLLRRYGIEDVEETNFNQ